MAKAKKKRADNYEEKLKINSVDKLAEKKPEPAKEDTVESEKDALKKQDKPIK